jgi:hypothetical protein
VSRLRGQDHAVRDENYVLSYRINGKEMEFVVGLCSSWQRIRRGVFRSIADLQAAINACLAEHNATPKLFVRTKSADAILAKFERCPVSSI